MLMYCAMFWDAVSKFHKGETSHTTSHLRESHSYTEQYRADAQKFKQLFYFSLHKFKGENTIAPMLRELRVALILSRVEWNFFFLICDLCVIEI